ncbi:MAG: Transcription elongation factor GreA [Candidatus Anoxychlamydiales bacterium]|nr:Transcription elongation factor GreA [Candidatus Anoxychlamydiales bacterium]
MTYLKQFIEKIKLNDYQGFLKIFEEYCFSDEVNYEELKSLLLEVKESDLAEDFGQHVNRTIFLWEKLEDEDEKNEILKLICDLQNKNDAELASIVYEHLKKKYSKDPLFNEKIRLIGLRSRENFQGAISKFELLTHMKKGKFVFHKAGWGTGEILDLSLLREEMSLEFEYVVGHKSLSFGNALKTLVPLKDDHFLSRRFGNPDLLEKQTKENPIEIIKLLIKDLGPQNAADIKEAICDLVIPSKQWNRWWQNARSKIKKDKKIQSPKKLSEPFLLREKEINHEEVLYKNLEAKPKPKEIIQMIHAFLRDFPQMTKNEDFKNSLTIKLVDVLGHEDLTEPEKIQIHFLLDTLKVDKELIKIDEIIKENSSPMDILKDIGIVSFKKRFLISIRKYKNDWEAIFLDLFFSLEQNILRDYILQELMKTKADKLTDKIKELSEHPLLYPSAFVWYFQKAFFAKEGDYPLADKDGKNKYFESFLILLDYLENKPEYKDLAKKMLSLITAKRYEMIQNIMNIANINQAKEYLLLATKCRILDDHDIKIIHSLAKVVFPDLSDYKNEIVEETVVWATEQGLLDLKKKITHISTIEMLDNAKEIEEARALGDLRENAEYKAALEKRARLQTALKTYADLLNNIKILTKDVIETDKISIGTIISSSDEKGKKITFTILGPVEADIEKNILSFQSNLAKELIGKTIGEKFEYESKTYTITDIRSVLD